VMHSLTLCARTCTERGSSGSASMAAPARPLQRHEDAGPRLHSSAGRPRDQGAVRGRTDRATSVHTCRHDTQDMHSSHEMCECATNTARCAAGEVASVVNRTDGRREDEHDGPPDIDSFRFASRSACGTRVGTRNYAIGQDGSVGITRLYSVNRGMMARWTVSGYQ